MSEIRKTFAGRVLRWLLLAVVISSAISTAAIAQDEKKSSAAAKRQFSAAAELQNEKLFDLSAKEWATFIKKYPTDPLVGKAKHYQGVCLIQLKKYTEAVAALSALIKADPKFELRDESLLNLGSAQYSLAAASNDKATFGLAAAAYDQLTKEYPKSKFMPTALFYLGECYYAMGDQAKAAAAYAEHVKQFPEDALRGDALYALGVTQLTLKQSVEAEATFDTFLKESPESPLATLMSMHKADALFDQGKFADAQALYAATAKVTNFEQADRSTLQQGHCLSNQKKFAEAAATFVSLTTGFPKSAYIAEATLGAGSCFHFAGSNEDAVKWLAKIQGGDAVTAAHYLARAYLAIGKAPEALAAVEKVLPMAAGNAFHVELLMDQADAMHEIPERRKDAVARYAAIAANHAGSPKAPNALYFAAWAAFDIGDADESLKHVEAYLQKHSDHELVSAVKSVAGDSYLKTKAYDSAEATFRELLQKFPNNDNAQRWKLLLGWSLYHQKKHQDTVATLAPFVATAKAADIKSEAVFLVGSSHFALKEYEKARDELKSSYDVNPKSANAANALLTLSRSQRLLKDLKTAQETAKKLIAEFPASNLLDRAHYHLGEFLYSDGNYKDAAAAYSTLIEKWPNSPLIPSALYWLGWSQSSLDQNDLAIVSFTSLITDHVDHELIGPARFARGKAYRKARKHAEAVKDLDAYLATNPAQKDKSAALLEKGLAQMDLEDNPGAIESLQAIVDDDVKFASMDKVKYNLAWALKDTDKEEEAVKVFAALATDHPDSSFAGEGHYHVGQKHYDDKEYVKAAAAYTQAQVKAAAAGEESIAEISAHKLGWSQYHQTDYKKAHDVFAGQVKSFANGKYVAEGNFMVAECLFKQDQFDAALGAYQKVIANPPKSEDFQMLVLLHGGQSAAASDEKANWVVGLKMLEECRKKFGEKPAKHQMQFAIARIKKQQAEYPEALKLFEEVTAAPGEIGCRAQLMIGDIKFLQKEHKEAIGEYVKVFRGYRTAPKSYDKWKAQATYEAAVCYQELKAAASAKKYFQEVIDKFPESEVVGPAKDRLKALN
jgi:TolA-binding protein